jgi:hypothetical protein
MNWEDHGKIGAVVALFDSAKQPVKGITAGF